MTRLVTAVLLLSNLTHPPAAPSTPIVINELLAGAYVEVRNVSPTTAHIGGYQLWMCDSSIVTGAYRISLHAQLPPGGFYVFASASFTGGSADQVTMDVLPVDGAMLLDRSYRWLDGVATVPDSPCGEGGSAPSCPDLATARDAASLNTGDNAADFGCRPPSPGLPNDAPALPPSQPAPSYRLCAGLKAGRRAKSIHDA